MALSYLYDHYSPALYGIVHRIVGQEEVAEEVLQDTFVKIWDKIATYDSDKGRLFTWMLNIARNLAIDKLRSKEFTHIQKTDRLDTTVSSMSPTMYVEQKMKDHGLVNLLRQLSPEQQMIVDLIYFKGYTHSEVAQEFEHATWHCKNQATSRINQITKTTEHRLNISEYIASGILEVYVLGELPPAEATEVENMAANHSEIREEISRLQETYEALANQLPVMPRATLKDDILNRLAPIDAETTQPDTFRSGVNPEESATVDSAQKTTSTSEPPPSAKSALTAAQSDAVQRAIHGG